MGSHTCGLSGVKQTLHLRIRTGQLGKGNLYPSIELDLPRHSWNTITLRFSVRGGHHAPAC